MTPRWLLSALALPAVLAAGALLLTLPALAGAPSAEPADTHHVYVGGNIQAAINAASPGDTVLVHAGTYTETITMRSGISLHGQGLETTILSQYHCPAG